MRSLVINLTRFGDLLQTQPVFAALARQGHRTGLVCLQNFAAAAQLVTGLESVHPVPGARLLADLDGSWPRALGGCLAWSDAVRQGFAPDRVINLTPSLAARLMARSLAGDAPVLGFGLDEFGFGTYSSPWAAFLEATALYRGASPFNVADIFFKAAHLGDAAREFALARPSAADTRAVRELIASQTGAGRAGLAGIQLGASAEKRRWPVEHFAAVADFLWERRRLLPVLLGSADEAPLAARFARACKAPHADLTGKTTLPLLAAAVSELRLLATNDTGTMHLAAGLGVPVLALFLATAQPWDTGPYLAGCCCLEPDMPCHPCSFDHQCPIGWACRAKLPPEAACACLDGWLTEGRWPEVPGRGARVWESYADPHGFMCLRSLSGHGNEARSVWNMIQRSVLRRFLDGQPQDAAPDTPHPLPEDFSAPLRDALSQAGSILSMLEAQARALSVSPRSAMREKFMAAWQRVHDLLGSDKRLSALAHLWLHLSQAQGQDMASFAAFASSMGQAVSALLLRLAPAR